MNTFCNCRIHEDYRDPLDCHYFLSCTGSNKPLKRDCQHAWLVYDPLPQPDRCVNKKVFACFEYKEKSGEESSYNDF